MRYHPLRWFAFSIFVISSTLNYLDRTLFTVLAPLIMRELNLNQVGFGWLISAFSLPYAAASLFAGWFLDRAGVNRAALTAVGWWSGATISTGFVSSLSGLAFCRSALGIGASAGVPAVGKLNGLYLKPEERALGAAVNGVGISLGSAVAPLFIGMAVAHSWRTPFIVTGSLGLLWIPLWLLVNRSLPPVAQRAVAAAPHDVGERSSGFRLLLQRPLILLMIANVLWMSGYTLWSNWTTLYLTHVHHLTLQDTAVLVWIPPIASNLGGFFGGWLSMRSIRRGVQSVRARQRAVWVSAAGSFCAFFLLFAANAWWATVIISLSFFFVLAGSVNIYALPIDMYGAKNAGFTVSALTFAYGVLQAVISPLIGFLGDHGLYRQVVWLVTVPAVLSSITLLGCNPSGGSITVERDTK
ncbi:MAG: MFS transporter [Acidobacteriaceae bacterium]|nr:MFS transporter [Acidobacteriaceae bacterium]